MMIVFDDCIDQHMEVNLIGQKNQNYKSNRDKSRTTVYGGNSRSTEMVISQG